jgi:anti-anti-sigma factor
VTHIVAQDVGPVTLTVQAAPDGAVIVALGGDLDIASAPAVRERLLSLLRPGACRLVIDMSAVRYADASGLAVLVSTQRRAVLLGGGLGLAALRPEVAGVLTVTGLSRHLAAYPTVQAAVVGREPGSHAALPTNGPALMAAQALPAQAQAGSGADSGELHAAVAALLASADAWR